MLLEKAESFSEEMRLLLLKAMESGNLVTVYGGFGGIRTQCLGRVVGVTRHTAVIECQELDGEEVEISRFHTAIDALVAVDVYQGTLSPKTLSSSPVPQSDDEDPDKDASRVKQQ